MSASEQKKMNPIVITSSTMCFVSPGFAVRNASNANQRSVVAVAKMIVPTTVTMINARMFSFTS